MGLPNFYVIIWNCVSNLDGLKWEWWCWVVGDEVGLPYIEHLVGLEGEIPLRMFEDVLDGGIADEEVLLLVLHITGLKAILLGYDMVEGGEVLVGGFEDDLQFVNTLELDGVVCPVLTLAFG